MSARATLLFLVVANGACAYRTPNVHAPLAMVAATPRLEEIVVVARTGAPPDPVLAADVQRFARAILEDAHVGVAPRAEGRPMRIHLRVDQRRDVFDSMHDDGIAALLLVAAPLGLYVGHARVSVDVTIEDGAATRVGHGEGARFGSLYAPALRRAIADALGRALSDLRVEWPAERRGDG